MTLKGHLFVYRRKFTLKGPSAITFLTGYNYVTAWKILFEVCVFAVTLGEKSILNMGS